MRTWLLAAALLPAALGQPKWTLEYFYDEAGKELRITDLAFPSATRGIAVGEIIDRHGGRKPQFSAVLTSDGGAHWSLEPLKEFPRSIFFLNESAGWMVTSEAIWFSDEAGRGWRRISEQIKPNRKLEDAPSAGVILRVYFLDERHGFAVGLQKSVYETHDGGRTWTPVTQAATPATRPAHSVYSQIAFADSGRGLIAGGYLPRMKAQDDDEGLPDWMFPGRAVGRRQQPLISIELETRDGGKSWNSGTAPVFGSITRLRLQGSVGLAVFGYADSFEWPSEVYRLDLPTGKSESVFKQKDRRVFDAKLLPDGRAILAAIEPPGRLRSAPIPGKVKMLESADLRTWTEMAVDYRAVAQTLVLAGPDPDNLRAATDTGMILRLSR